MAAKKNGKVALKEYQSDAFCRQLAPLAAKLNEEIADVKHDPKGLGMLLAQVLQFQEDALGVNSLPPREFPKLPLRLLEDPRPGGALHLMAARLAAIKRATPQLKAFDWANPGSRRFNLENLQIIRADLLRAGLLKVPVIAAHPSCGPDAQAALEAARKLQATVVEDPADPSVTHVLYPNGSLCIPEDDPGSQMRTLVTSGPRARVHWRFLPDSYAEWVPVKSAPNVGADRSEPPGGRYPWRVTMRWAVDSEKYNEWMNPQDYEADEQKAKTVAAAKAAAALGVGGAAGADEAAKRAAQQLAQAAALAGAKRPRGDAEVDAADPGEELGPGLVRRRVLRAHPAAVEGGAAAENISQGQLDPTAAIPMVEPPPKAADLQQQQQPGGAEQQPGGGGEGGDEPEGGDVAGHRLVMPSHASWFSINSIHANERRALPDLGISLTEYKKMRDQLVILYRRRPGRRLTLEEARDWLSAFGEGALAVLPRVYSFLDSWGVINWLALKPQPTPAAASLPAGTRLARATLPPGVPLPGTGGRGAFIGSSTARLLQLRLPSVLEGVAAAGAGGTLNMAQREGRGGSKLEPCTTLAAPRRIFCSAMPWVDCTALRYHCTRQPGVDLCPQAFAEGRFPPGCSAADFVRLEGGADHQSAADAAASSKWTPQETLLMCEALDMHGDNWQLVSEHVGTHSVLECITHFLQLPIEDDFLDEFERTVARPPGAPGAGSPGSGEGGASHVSGGGGEGAAGGGRVPLGGEGSAGNPVSSSLALLAVVLAPRVAAAAAQAALEVLASDDPEAAAAAIDARRRGCEQHTGVGAGGGADGIEVDAADGNGAAPPAAPATPPDAARPVTAEHARAAAAVALAAAAARAKAMADEQEEEMERLAREVLRVQLKRVNIKLKYLEQMDEVLGAQGAQPTPPLVKAEADRGGGGDARRKR